MLSEDATARWCASVIVLILPRQNGKNAVLEALELYAFYVLEERRIIHTAQLAKTAADHMSRMVALIASNPELDAITRVYKSNGKEKLLRTDTGAVLEFITRGRKTVRGGSPSRVVFDEALFLTDEQIQAILPSLSAQSMNADPPQMIYTSSAPLPESLVLHRLRNHAIAGGDDRTFFAEWSIPTDFDLHDDDLLTAALLATNPGMGIRISEEWIRQTELVPMSREAFLIERLGYVEPAEGVIRIVPAETWAKTADENPLPKLAEADRVLAWDVSPDRSKASIGFVALRSDGNWHQEIVQQFPGTEGVATRIASYVAKAGPIVKAVAVVKGSPAYALLEEVQALITLEVVELSQQDYAAGCGSWFDKTLAGTLRRVQARNTVSPLDQAVSAAVWRDVGDVRVFDRRGSGDITPLCATVAALVAIERYKPEPALLFAY